MRKVQKGTDFVYRVGQGWTRLGTFDLFWQVSKYILQNYCYTADRTHQGQFWGGQEETGKERVGADMKAMLETDSKGACRIPKGWYGTASGQIPNPS